MRNSTNQIEKLDKDSQRKIFIDNFLNSTKKKILYVHTPLCMQKCKFCYLDTSQCLSPEEPFNHYKVLFEDLETYKDIFNNIIFDEIYFGGGTPTVAPPHLMESLFERIPNFKNIKNKCIESHPKSTTSEYMELFKKYEFDFISFGIQTLDYNIAKKQNMIYTDHQTLLQMSKYLNNTDLYFNYDLICYLEKEDIRDINQFKEDLYFIMSECKPTGITLQKSFFSKHTQEMTRTLINLIKEALNDHQDWKCVTSYLLDENIENDTIFDREYKIASKRYDYMHHLWCKLPGNLLHRNNTLSIGSTEKHPIYSMGDEFAYEKKFGMIKNPNIKDTLYHEEFKKLRKERGFEI